MAITRRVFVIGAAMGTVGIGLGLNYLRRHEKVVNRNPHDPFLIGNNFSYMAVGYFPTEELKKILPQEMSIPSDQVMSEKYPTVKKIKGMHPFMIMISKCYNVHDLMTNHDLRPYEEIIFYFPVIYTHKNEQQLCSYAPVLYLDFLLGVIGGLYVGLRKQYHPKMKVEGTQTSRSYLIKDTLDASFQQTSTNSSKELDPFFAQMFKVPTVTVSYFNKTYFYTAKVSPGKVLDTSAVYEWRYKGSVLKSNENTFANYSEYSFTISQAMRYEDYFHPATSVE